MWFITVVVTILAGLLAVYFCVKHLKRREDRSRLTSTSTTTGTGAASIIPEGHPNSTGGGGIIGTAYLDRMRRSILFIDTSNDCPNSDCMKGTGCIVEEKLEGRTLKLLMTCNHILPTEDVARSSRIWFDREDSTNPGNEIKGEELFDFREYFKTSSKSELDFTVVAMKPEKIPGDRRPFRLSLYKRVGKAHQLKPDDQVLLWHYPHDDHCYHRQMSYHRVNFLSGYLIGHLAQTKKGSSGCPVLKEVNNELVLVGLHRGSTGYNTKTTSLNLATHVHAIHYTLLGEEHTLGAPNWDKISYETTDSESGDTGFSKKELCTLKCVLLTPSGFANLESIPKKYTVPRESLDWSNRVWLKLEDSEETRITSFNFRGSENSFTSFCDFLAEGEGTINLYICFLISPQPQYFIHYPILIRSSGVFIVCFSASSNEMNEGEKIAYVTQVLDRIVASTPPDSQSVVFVEGLAIEGIQKKYEDSVKVMIIPIDNDFLSEVPNYIWHHKMKLTFSQQIFDFLKTRPPLVLYEECKNGWEDENFLRSLEDLHKTGIIFFERHESHLDESLIFIQPKLLHEMLSHVHKMINSGKNVECIVRHVQREIDRQPEYKLRFKNKTLWSSFMKLLVQLELAVEIKGKTKLLHSIQEKANLDAIHSSVSPLLVKFEDMTSFPHTFIFEFANCLEFAKKGDYHHLAISETARNCITFKGHGYTLYLCQRENAVLEVHFQAVVSENFPPKSRLERFKHCQYIQEAVKRVSEKLSRKPIFGFNCRAQHDCDRFACYVYQSETSILSCSAAIAQEICLNQKLWFGFQGELVVECARVPDSCIQGMLLRVTSAEECPEGKVTTDIDYPSLPEVLRLKPSDAGLQGVIQLVGIWDKVAISLGVNMHIIEGKRQSLNPALDSLLHWRNGNTTNPVSWEFLLKKIGEHELLGNDVAEMIKQKIVSRVNRDWTRWF